MLSTAYRLRLQSVCDKIVKGETVELSEMVWAQKLSKANTSAREMLKKARYCAANPNMIEGSMDDFLNNLGLGNPDPSNYRSGFQSADEIVEWFAQDKSDDWRQHD